MAGMRKNEMETRPPTQTEETIFAILSRCTAVPLYAALPKLNIFARGLDSMAIIQFVQNLSKEFGHRISASDIMTTPTLSGITSLLDDVPSSPASIVGSYAADFSSKWSDSVRSIYAMNSVEAILMVFMKVFYLDLPTTIQYFFDNEFKALVIVLSPERLSLPSAEEQTSIEEFVKGFLVTHAPLVAQDINATLRISCFPFDLIQNAKAAFPCLLTSAFAVLVATRIYLANDAFALLNSAQLSNPKSP
ncbi:hypothetical protein DXG01_002282 [Tephrocybe rancida]|nr:hypothetical protein DXG01_002282 [Tephrocybe rancida]